MSYFLLSSTSTHFPISNGNDELSRRNQHKKQQHNPYIHYTLSWQKVDNLIKRGSTDPPSTPLDFPSSERYKSDPFSKPLRVLSKVTSSFCYYQAKPQTAITASLHHHALPAPANKYVIQFHGNIRNFTPSHLVKNYFWVQYYF